MFSGPLPPYLDLRKFSDQERVIEGEARVEDFPRLREYRESLGQPVRVALAFGQDAEGRRQLQGRIDTRLILVCQRCLAPVEKDINAEVALTLVWSESQAKALPAELEPLLVRDDRLPLSDLVEEELLLAMPLVALHEQCPHPLTDDHPVGGEEKIKPDNPFAVLAPLKGRRK